MRALKVLLQKTERGEKDSPGVKKLDEKTIFFLFEKIVLDYYGRRGKLVIYPVAFKEHTMTLKVASPLWAQELMIQKEELCERLNREVGEDILRDIRVIHGMDSGF